jgi:hypothetical protein
LTLLPHWLSWLELTLGIGYSQYTLMHVIGSWFCLGSFECQDVNFESKLHKYVSCFKLTVLKIGTFYMIWMFWCYLLVFFSNTFGYGSMTC